jgi:NAD(P)-dependent dehydrogenase (short-subunit alcohol dehydrogenase family)
MTFAGKIAVVTGGTSGLGLAAAKELASQGARVVVTGRRKAQLDHAVAAIGGGAVGYEADVSKVEDITALFSQISSDLGSIDVLVANAGYGEI